MSAADHKSEAWHRNPWVWLIIAIPSLTVLGCLFTIYLAITNPLTLVNSPVEAEVQSGETATPDRR